MRQLIVAVMVDHGDGDYPSIYLAQADVERVTPEQVLRAAVPDASDEQIASLLEGVCSQDGEDPVLIWESNLPVVRSK